MTFLDALKNQVDTVANNLEGEETNVQALETAGVCVIRNAIPRYEIKAWQSQWYSFYESVADSRKINKFNPVDFIANVPAELKAIDHSNSIIKYFKPIFGDNIGLYNTKFLVKDKYSDGPVFLHQDFAYAHGTSDKVTAFVSLENTTIKSGMVRFYLGTHKLGYLGDAGEIDLAILGENWPILHVDLNLGDMVLMHCMTWHDSPPNTSDNIRVVLGVTYQHADDYSTKEVVSGCSSWSSIGSEQLSKQDQFFKRSRVSRLKQLEREVAGIPDPYKY